MKSKNKRKDIQKKIARERIEKLFKAAELFFSIQPGLEEPAIKLILRLVQKYKVKLKKEEKMKICKKCYSLLVPSKTAIVRLEKNVLTIRCLKCGNIKRYPYVREKREAKKNG